MEDLQLTPKQEQVVQDLGKPAAVLRAELASVATEYTAFNFNTEELRFGDARSEALILSFLYLKAFTFTHPDVYSVLSDIFHLPPIRIGHSPPRQLFKQARILGLSRSSTELLKPNRATLYPRTLREHEDLPFVTMRVIRSLYNLGVY